MEEAVVAVVVFSLDEGLSHSAPVEKLDGFLGGESHVGVLFNGLPQPPGFLKVEVVDEVEELELVLATAEAAVLVLLDILET